MNNVLAAGVTMSLIFSPAISTQATYSAPNNDRVHDFEHTYEKFMPKPSRITPPNYTTEED